VKNIAAGLKQFENLAVIGKSNVLVVREPNARNINLSLFELDRMLPNLSPRTFSRQPPPERGRTRCRFMALNEPNYRWLSFSGTRDSTSVSYLL
jgi:hypothetical protein